MKFEQELLDRIREAVPVSEVVARKFTLRREGRELVAVEDKSITVNDAKRLWWDFGKGEHGGDIFEFLVQHEGLTFPQAVEELAKRAGVSLPQRSGRNERAGAERERIEENRGSDTSAATKGEGRREVVATWDYADPRGRRYQVVRFQKKLADGSWERGKGGKTWKSFGQRTPSPDSDGSWVWGLSFNDDRGNAKEFMRRGQGADWQAFDDAKFTAWRYTERRSWPGVADVQHWLYGADEVGEELKEERADQRTVFVPEGEGKVDALRSWNLLATCNSGGARNWTDAHAEFFRDAADVVIVEDNDAAGRERTARIAPMLLDRGARVRRLDMRDLWPECPEKGDVRDWIEGGLGTREQMLELVDKLPDWQPEPYRSKFGAVSWRDQDKPFHSAYEWAIKGIIPMRQPVLIMGPSRSGKSFEAMDMCLTMAKGHDFAGRRTKQLGTVYCFYEAHYGASLRMRAYRQHHGLRPEDDLPFIALCRPPNLYTADENVASLTEEILKLTDGWKIPLGQVVLDTHNAATRGSSEIKSEDVSLIMERYTRLMDKTGAGLWVIGHTNTEGKHRGNEQLFNGIEAAIEIKRVEDKGTGERRDDEGRIIRRASVVKQREGSDDNVSWEFVLRTVTVGADEDGDPETSCVSIEPARSIEDREQDDANDAKKRGRLRPPPGGVVLNGGEARFYRAMQKALGERGIKPPAALNVPHSVGLVVRWADFSSEYRRQTPSDEADTPEGRAKYADRVKKAVTRAREALQQFGVIGVDVLPGTQDHVMWFSGRPVVGPGLRLPDTARASAVDSNSDNAEGSPPRDDDMLPEAVF